MSLTICWSWTTFHVNLKIVFLFYFKMYPFFKKFFNLHFWLFFSKFTDVAKNWVKKVVWIMINGLKNVLEVSFFPLFPLLCQKSLILFHKNRAWHLNPWKQREDIKCKITIFSKPTHLFHFQPHNSLMETAGMQTFSFLSFKILNFIFILEALLYKNLCLRQLPAFVPNRTFPATIFPAITF